MSDMDDFANPSIREHREFALAALNLSPAQLEHGLQLHRDSIVIDAYGFSAFASPDYTRVKQAMADGLNLGSVRATQLTSSMTRMADDQTQREYFIEAWRAAGVTCLMRNSGEEGNSIERMLPRLAHNTYTTDRLSDVMHRIVEAKDVHQAKQAGRFGFCYTTNGVPLPVSWETAADGLRFIAIFRQLGVRMMHLTYNRRNVLGDGCAEPANAGLSDFGRQAVAQMNRDGVIVDLAHTGEQTCLDVAACSEKPVVVSHATCRALHEHYRGKSDAVLKAVAQTGGVVGICAIPDFLGGSGDIRALLDHVDHAVRIVGDEHVAIGTDVSVILPASPGDESQPERPAGPQPAMRFEAFWPGKAFDAERWGKPEQVHSLSWTNWPLFTAGLVQRGYTDEQIKRIVGLNMLRVLEAHDPSR